MNYSPEQERAIKAVHDWFHDDSAKPVFFLDGYAGTGKTTLAKEFAEGIQGGVYFATFTGKAAYVLRQKGCPATTIHKLIYTPKNKSQEHHKGIGDELIEVRKALADPDFASQGRVVADLEKREAELVEQLHEEEKNLERPMFSLNLESPLKDAATRLVIIDERSMVDKQMGADLLSFGVKVLMLGDPGQLPPVGADTFYEGNPDFMLEEIHRQAKDSPIIRLATMIRNGIVPDLGEYGESRVITRNEFNKEIVLQADQVLVGKNQTRHDFNGRYRELREYNGVTPIKGDRLVCLRNNHDQGLLNGGLWNVHECHDDPDSESCLLSISDTDDPNTRIDVTSHRRIFTHEKIPFFEKKDAEEFDFGYALTCHKAQGSQWKNVCIFDESSIFRQNRYKWLYTAVTRASEKVTLCLQP